MQLYEFFSISQPTVSYLASRKLSRSFAFASIACIVGCGQDMAFRIYDMTLCLYVFGCMRTIYILSLPHLYWHECIRWAIRTHTHTYKMRNYDNRRENLFDRYVSNARTPIRAALIHRAQSRRDKEKRESEQE